MKRFFYQIFCGIAFFLLIPIVVTLLIQGTGTDSAENLSFMPSTEEQEGELDEDFLRGIVANEISMDTEPEAIKAQAVIARTNCLRAMERGENLPEGLTKGEMVRLWGQENFSERYSLLESSIEATKGVSMVYNGSYIQADFHKISAGYTRDAAEVYGNEDFPYLKSIDSRMDLIGEDFLKVIFYTPNELIAKGGELFTDETKAAAAEMSASGFMEKISISKRDKAGYVTEVTIDGKPHSGEEARLLYGWNSSNFSLKEVDGEIRVTTKGLGHGLGVSLHGANELAKDGFSYKEILKYFYSGIEFVTQYD
ncbi:MAG: SpoIID/LytB domain-containing protein [Eubacterium sp.]|nr:SpoIID/LytB domain-containing protein [Eubacterium sp.]